MWQFARSIDGIAAPAAPRGADRRRQRVVLQRDRGEGIHPTPMIAMVG